MTKSAEPVGIHRLLQVRVQQDLLALSREAASLTRQLRFNLDRQREVASHSSLPAMVDVTSNLSTAHDSLNEIDRWLVEAAKMVKGGTAAA